jgi:hypothetical protein
MRLRFDARFRNGRMVTKAGPGRKPEMRVASCHLTTVPLGNTTCHVA